MASVYLDFSSGFLGTVPEYAAAGNPAFTFSLVARIGGISVVVGSLVVAPTAAVQVFSFGYTEGVGAEWWDVRAFHGVVGGVSYPVDVSLISFVAGV